MLKVISFNQITRYKHLWQSKKTVLVGGCFEIFHYGHLQFINKAANLGDFLIVALESDQFIVNKKKRQPIHNQSQRAAIIAAIEKINLVIKLPYFESDDHYQKLVTMVKPDFIAVTAGDDKIRNKKRQIESVGGRVVTVIKRIKQFSSTVITKNETIFSD